ncbi:hypothetical protein [Leisingera sp.]|uniref:hypothetical protein n=1 Tax=Leisingera sp. TaxID=1879318 RepID=UPI002B26D5B1|nr:hypothetical protein [Leisingera sp.]
MTVEQSQRECSGSGHLLSASALAALPIDGEAAALIARSIAAELESFAVAHGVTHDPVEGYLHFVVGVIERNSADLLDFRCVPASGAACLGAVEVSFSYEGYRLAAQAAKDAILDVINGDDNV